MNSGSTHGIDDVDLRMGRGDDQVGSRSARAESGRGKRYSVKAANSAQMTNNPGENHHQRDGHDHDQEADGPDHHHRDQRQQDHVERGLSGFARVFHGSPIDLNVRPGMSGGYFLAAP